MTHARLTAALVVTLIALTATAEAQEVIVPGNRLTNPGAENGLAAWTNAGFGVGRYGSAGGPTAGTASQFGLGAQFFAGQTGGATLSQEVDFSDLAASLDQPGYALQGSAYLGAATTSSDDPTVSFQPLSTDGAPLGTATLLGPSSSAERRGETVLVSCFTKVPTPPGTRKVLVTLTAGGTSGQPSTAAVDRVSIGTAPPPVPPASGGAASTRAAGGSCTPYSPPSAPVPVQPAPVQPAQPAAPGSTSTPGPQTARPSLTALRLTRSSVTVRTSKQARVTVLVERRMQTASGKRSWKRAKSMTLAAPMARLVRRQFARLPAGTYRVSARLVGRSKFSRRLYSFG